jgi:hypothetical protein
MPSILNFIRKLAVFLLLTGTTLMLLFILLSGTVNHFPFKNFFWVEANVSFLKTVDADFARWTFWGLCYANGNNGFSNLKWNCTGLGPAVPISPLDNWGVSSDLPSAFIDNRDAYYYLSRFGFAFIFIAFGFTAIAFILNIYIIIFKKGSITLLISFGFIFCLVASCLFTAVTVMTRNQFNHVSSAKINASSIGMLWASTCSLLILLLVRCCTSVRGYKKRKDEETLTQQQPEQIPLPPPGFPAQHEDYTQPAQHESAGIRFFKINRNQEKNEEESVYK